MEGGSSRSHSRRAISASERAEFLRHSRAATPMPRQQRLLGRRAGDVMAAPDIPEFRLDAVHGGGAIE